MLDFIKQLDFNKVLTWNGIKSIFQGCAEHIQIKAQKSTELVMSVYKHRRPICANCDLGKNGRYCDSTQRGTAITDFKYGSEQRYAGRQYKGCSCDLNCKTANLHESCPLGKWLAVQ